MERRKQDTEKPKQPAIGPLVDVGLAGLDRNNPLLKGDLRQYRVPPTDNVNLARVHRGR